MTEINGMLAKVLDMTTAEPQLGQHLHLPALGLWPYLIGALRRQREAVASNELLQVIVLRFVLLKMFTSVRMISSAYINSHPTLSCC